MEAGDLTVTQDLRTRTRSRAEPQLDGAMIESERNEMDDR